MLGTNPLSFAVPGRKGQIDFLIDQSASAVTWTAVKRAAEDNRDIPLGWALDKFGRPTTDPREGLEGSMAPAGGYKGFGQGFDRRGDVRGTYRLKPRTADGILHFG